MTLQEAYIAVRTHYNIRDLSKGEATNKRKYLHLHTAKMYVDCGAVSCRDCPVANTIASCETLQGSGTQLRKQIRQLEFLYKVQK